MASLHSKTLSDIYYERPSPSKQWPVGWYLAAAASGVGTLAFLLFRDHLVKSGEERFGFSDFNTMWFGLRVFWPTVVSTVLMIVNLILINRCNRAIPALINAVVMVVASHYIIYSLYESLVGTENTMICPTEDGRNLATDQEFDIDCIIWQQQYRAYVGFYLVCAVTHGLICARLFVSEILRAIKKN